MGLDLESFVKSIGYVGLVLIVFAESGLFFGFFLPGDSLLLTAGMLASRQNLDVVALVIMLPLAAILGDNVGYWFGKKAGPAIFKRDNSLLFRRKNLLAAKAFYEKHGGKAIMLARFMPFIRTFAPIVAGAAEMHYPRFFTFNVLGGALWASGVTLIGYYLGTHVERYFLPVIVVVVFISALPAVIHAWKEYRAEVFGFIRSRWQAWRSKRGRPDGS